MKLLHMENGEKKSEKPLAGFTLMEVVIAIAIFSICVSAVYLLYSSVIRVVENVEQSTGLDRDARVALDRLSLDLEGLHRGTQGFLAGREPSDQLDGEPFLTFTSASHLILDPDEYPVDITVIRYYLEKNNDDGGYTLLRSDTAIPGTSSPEAAEARKHVLAVDVAELKIIYVGEDGEETDTWDSEPNDENDEEENYFPRAFLVSLQLRVSGDAGSEPTEYRGAVVVPQLVYEFEDDS